MKIYTHPANLSLLRERYERGEYDALPGGPWGIEIVANSHLSPSEPTGRYLLPDGAGGWRPVALEAIRLRSRFVEYGPEDLGYLLLAGLARPEIAPRFYMIRETPLHLRFSEALWTPRPPFTSILHTA